MRAKSLPMEKEFAIHVNGEEVTRDHDSDDSGCGSRSTTYTNLSNQSSRRPSSFDFWPDEIQLEHLNALSKERFKEDDSDNEKAQRKEEVLHPNSSNILLPIKASVRKPPMDYLTVKPLH